MKSYWEEIVQHELQNIEELKINEACEASKTTAVSFLNEFLLNMLSNQVEISVDFDSCSWSENMSSKDTS